MCVCVCACVQGPGTYQFSSEIASTEAMGVKDVQGSRLRLGLGASRR